MALITLTGDSDGDLHTAAMHNSKFGAIASVINGNIGIDNLAVPNAAGFFTFNLTGYVATFPWDTTAIAAGTTGVAVMGYQEFYGVSSATSATIAGSIYGAGNGVSNILKSSWIKVPTAITITHVQFAYRQLAGSYTASENFTVALQRSSGANATDSFVNVASFTEDFRGTATELTIQTPAVGNAGVGAGYFMRICFTNPASYTPDLAPPSMTCTVRYKHNLVA
tara:strand:+ start:1115 stop:1786 length:672 start_codon:yes stop_codon:yes gene_type:complete